MIKQKKPSNIYSSEFVSKDNLDKKYKIINVKINSIIYQSFITFLQKRDNKKSVKITLYYFVNEKLNVLFDFLYNKLNNIETKELFNINRNDIKEVFKIIKSFHVENVRRNIPEFSDLNNDNFNVGRFNIYNLKLKTDKKVRFKLSLENYRKLNRFSEIFNISRDMLLNLFLNIIK